jgi:predicted permease
MRKVSLFFSRKRFRNDLDEEMAFHRAQAEKEFASAGMSAEEARYAARRQFGNSTRLTEQSHEVVGFRMETVLHDLRYALRQLRKNPGFAITAILILSLGMGVSVAIFGFVDAALVEPLPYSNPGRLVAVDEASATRPRSNLSHDDYLDWKRQNKSFLSFDVYTGMGWLLATPSGAVPVPAARVSDGFFSTLGVKATMGRLFLPGEDLPGKPKIAVLSYGTWLKRFGARPDIVGQSVNLSGDAFTIVGVLPREFAFEPRGNAEFWTPLLDLNPCDKQRGCHNFDGVARLRDGVTIQAALEEMKTIAAQLAQRYPGSNQGQSASVIPLSELIVGNVRPMLLTVLAAAGLLLLIACVNVANLVLVRSESRRREIAVRGALGATPIRLAGQFVTEGLLLAAVGCLCGLGVAVWVMTLLTRLIPKAMADGIPFLQLVGLNANTCLFAAAVALLAALLLAATPALRLSRQDIRDGLGDGDRGSANRLWRRMGASLVVVELTIAVVLLAGGGLLAKSFYRLLHVENGFDTTHLATVQVMATSPGYEKAEAKMSLYREINRRVGALPGVVSVGITSDLPVQCNCDTDWIRIVGKPFHGEHNEVDERDVSPDYLRTLKARLIAGRMLTADDDATKSHKILINESLAKKYFPGEDPIGQKIGNGALEPKSLREIVGVVADIREGGLDQDVWPAEYQSLYHEPDSFFAVAVRTVQDEKAMLPGIVRTIRQIDPGLGVYGEISMTDQIETSQSSLLHRFATWLVGGFAVIALVLSVVGLYGVVAYSVSQRTREIGVRMALGAQRGAVYGMVMRQAGWLTATGIALGLICAIGASLAMRKLLFGVAAWDATTLGAVAGVLGLASLLASFVPAMRAASVEPSEALRTE